MTRGLLSDEDLKQIDAKLVQVMPLREKTLRMHPVPMYAAFEIGSDIPVAAVCLQDATDALCDARVALHECYANRIYYRERKDPPEEHAAMITERFFIDDLAFRLYAAAEHLANAIIFMLELSDANLADHKKGRASAQLVVGHYLSEEKTEHPVSRAILPLAGSKEWLLSMDYRGRLVHDQPPTIDGLGIVYKRKSRWEKDGNSARIRVQLGGGDDPEYTIDEVREFMHQGFNDLVAATEGVVSHFEGMLGDVGITLSDDGCRMSFKLL